MIVVCIALGVCLGMLAFRWLATTTTGSTLLTGLTWATGILAALLAAWVASAFFPDGTRAALYVGGWALAAIVGALVAVFGAAVWGDIGAHWGRRGLYIASSCLSVAIWIGVMIATRGADREGRQFIALLTGALVVALALLLPRLGRPTARQLAIQRLTTP